MGERIEKIKEEGMDIAKELGNGVRYLGPQMDDGKLLFHFFNDDAVTKTSFTADTIEKAKEKLIRVRRLFEAPAPIF